MAGVGVIGAGPAGLLAANALTKAGVECVVFERLSEEAVRGRTRAGLIEARTVGVLDRHELSDGLRQRGSTSGACEFRRHGVRHVLHYGELAGADHHVYPQQQLVGDLIDALLGAGGEIRFATPVEGLGVSDRWCTVRSGDGEAQFDYVLGCDGFHGVARPSVPALTLSTIDFGAEWLSLLAEVPPAGDHTLYGLHSHGFAGQMLRSATVSRFYLQVEVGADAVTLSDDWVWDQLVARLRADQEEPVPGPIIERGLLELRSAVTEPMQHGRLFLAGDAAHIVTPAGGKGMNLALQDADELVAGLLEHYRAGEDRRLDAYTATRLPAVWHAVEFSHWMLDLLLARPEVGRFREGLRDARLVTLLTGGPFSHDFAMKFVGVDSDGPVP